MAAPGEGDAAGRGRHGRQAAHHGGPQVQHPQVGAGGLRPGHDPPEPRQPQPGIRRLQLPVGGAAARCAFGLVSTQLCCGGGEAVAVATAHRLVTKTTSGSLLQGGPGMGGRHGQRLGGRRCLSFPAKPRVAADRPPPPPQGGVHISASTLSRSNVKNSLSIFFCTTATAKKSNLAGGGEKEIWYIYMKSDGLEMENCHLLYQSFLHFNLLQSVL